MKQPKDSSFEHRLADVKTSQVIANRKRKGKDNRPLPSQRQIKHDVLHLVGCCALDHQGQIGYCRTDLQAVRNDDHASHGLTGIHAFEGVFGN
jgi:hypothetical protein